MFSKVNGIGLMPSGSRFTLPLTGCLKTHKHKINSKKNITEIDKGSEQ